MDKRSAIEVVRQYKVLVSQYFDVVNVYLYGSYSKGTQKEDSDIDVAIVVNSLSGDFFQYMPLLYKLRRSINSAIEPVIFSEKEKKAPLYEEVLKTGIAV